MTINLQVNEEWLSATARAALEKMGTITITSQDGEGCPLGWHLVVTGTMTKDNVTIHVQLQ